MSFQQLVLFEFESCPRVWAAPHSGPLPSRVLSSGRMRDATQEAPISDQDRALIDTHGEQDDVALAQLGAAVILAWPLLEPDLQRDLIATAAVVDGVKRDPSFEEVLTRLVQMNNRSRGHASLPPAPST